MGKKKSTWEEYKKEKYHQEVVYSVCCAGFEAEQYCIEYLWYRAPRCIFRAAANDAEALGNDLVVNRRTRGVIQLIISCALILRAKDHFFSIL